MYRIGAIVAVLAAGLLAEAASAQQSPYEFKLPDFSKPLPGDAEPEPEPAPHSPYEFKGLYPGGTMYEADMTLNDGDCYRDSDSCGDFTSIAGVFAFVYVKFLPSARIGSVSVSFKSQAYYTVRDAVVAKYGEPGATQHQKLMNRMGAEFDNPVDIWASGPYTMRLQRYIDADEGELEIVSQEYEDLEAARRAADKTDL